MNDMPDGSLEMPNMASISNGFADIEISEKFYEIAKQEQILNNSSVEDLLTHVATNGPLKEAAKNIFKQKYGNEVFRISVDSMAVFSFGLMYMKHFGDMATKVKLQFLVKFTNSLLGALENCSSNIVELELVDMERDEVELFPHKNDLETWRQFLSKLNTRFPKLQDLTFTYLFECRDCVYLDAMAQPFSSLTYLELNGRFRMSDVMHFLQFNPQIKRLIMKMEKNEVCENCGNKFLWMLPHDFMKQLDKALPNLGGLAMSIPSKWHESKTASKDLFRNLKVLRCDSHGPDSWIPNFLEMSGDKLEALELQLPYEKSIDLVAKKIAHLTKLRQITINGYVCFDDLDVMQRLSAAKIRKLIEATGGSLNKITIRLVVWSDSKIFKRDTEQVNDNELAQIQHKYRSLMENKINGFNWSVAGHMGEVVLSKIIK